QRATLERADQHAGTAHGELTGAIDVDDGLEAPVGVRAAAAPGWRQPGRARVRDAPDAQRAVLLVHADQRGLERGRGRQAAQLVRVQRAAAVEAYAQDSPVGHSVRW